MMLQNQWHLMYLLLWRVHAVCDTSMFWPSCCLL